MKDYLLRRLREPSTWAGLSVVAALVGVPPGTVEAAGQVVAGLFALAAALMPESKAQP